MTTSRFSSLLATLALLCAAVLLAAGCGGGGGGGGENEGGTLSVGSDIPYPPFEQGKPGHYTGFDVELVEAIAEKIGRKAEFKDTSFETIFRDVAQGKFDAVASAATITEEREKAVDFSNPYYLSEQALLVEEGSPFKELKELEGKTVGVQQGTTGQELAKEEIGSAEIRPFPEGPDAVNALKAGTVDGVVIDAPVAQNAVEKSGGLEIAEKIPTEEDYGIAVAQGDEGLLEEINQGLKEVQEDGTYKKIFVKWFHFPPPKAIFSATHEAE
jgi:polar amino acid transport system substrate-binding protein